MSPTKRTTKTKRAAPPHWTPDVYDLGLASYNVSDFERAKKFYGETLGLPVAEAMEPIGWIQYGYPNQAQLAISQWRGSDPMSTGAGGATVVFTCPNVRDAVARLRAKGVRCDDPVEVPGAVVYADFYDPDGNRLHIAQSIMPATV